MRLTEASPAALLILADHWGVTVEPGQSEYDAIVAALDADAPRERCWQAFAVLVGEIPGSDDVTALRRAIALRGAAHALEALPNPRRTSAFGDWQPPQIVETAVFVDVNHTSGTSHTTGIQRVVRETVRRWLDRPGVLPVAWTRDGTALRRLTVDELEHGVKGEGYDSGDADLLTEEHVIVPLSGTFIVAELAADPWRTRRLQSISEQSPLRVGVIGYDGVPVYSSETSQDFVVDNYPRYLHAVSAADRVAAISIAAQTEFEGWREMLRASGIPGPEIRNISLAATPGVTTDADIVDFAVQSGLDATQPLVLVVGSHEPRKNHLAILASARHLWNSGVDFSLCFVGGNAWGNLEFGTLVTELQAQGRPLTVLSKVTDGLLAAAYASASFSMFPSLNEGFGLPVVESLAAGTPVITSNFGSMREIGELHGGVVLADPRSDAALEAAMRELITDPERLAALRADAQAANPRDWDSYADEAFEYFTAN